LDNFSFDPMSGINKQMRVDLEKQNKMFESISKRNAEVEQREIKKATDIHEINEKLSNMWSTLETIVNSIGSNAQITQRELLEIKGTLLDMEKIMISDDAGEEKEKKLTQILKEGLKFGGQAASMLMFEYIKYQAKTIGFPMV